MYIVHCIIAESNIYLYRTVYTVHFVYYIYSEKGRDMTLC